MPHLCRRVSLLAASLALGGTVAAQQPSQSPTTGASPEPPRPHLVAGADSNDAAAYVAFAAQRGRTVEERFAAAYWARRLNPENVKYRDQLVQAAAMRQGKGWLEKYDRGDRKTLTSPAAQMIDSLARDVYIRDPFIHVRPAPPFCVAPPMDVLRRAKDVAEQGFMYAFGGCFRDAVDAWGRAIAADTQYAGLRWPRTELFLSLGWNLDAAKDLSAAIDDLRKRDETHLTYRYRTKDLLEYALGLIYQKADSTELARAAFERALGENLSFYPAHLRLADMAMMRADTAAALREYAAAVQVRDADGLLHYRYASALSMIGHPAEAIAELQRALALEPYFADAYYLLGFLLDGQKRGDEALAAYRGYVAHAAASQKAQVDDAKQRIAALSATPAAKP